MMPPSKCMKFEIPVNLQDFVREHEPQNRLHRWIRLRRLTVSEGVLKAPQGNRLRHRRKKIREPNRHNKEENIEYTSDPAQIKLADFVIIAVPTPVTKSNLRSQTCDMSNPPLKLSATI